MNLNEKVFAGIFWEEKLLALPWSLTIDKQAGFFLHGFRQAINLSVPASLEIPALRLRREKEGGR